jgi:hypothetical protein
MWLELMGTVQFQKKSMVHSQHHLGDFQNTKYVQGLP